MKKLKTLKDLKREWEYDPYSDAVIPFKRNKPITCDKAVVIFDELRQEAIKHYKSLNPCSAEDQYIRAWIEHFFNLTEEDLGAGE